VCVCVCVCVCVRARARVRVCVLVGGNVLRIGYLPRSLTFARAHSEDTSGKCYRFPTAIAAALKPLSRTEIRVTRGGL